MPESESSRSAEDCRQLCLPGFDAAEAKWREDFARSAPRAAARENRSGIALKPLYSPADWNGQRYLDDLGFPGQAPWTRGVHPSMYAARSWSQRQLVGFGLPNDYRGRLKTLLDTGLTSVSIAPCNTFMRGLDADQVEPELLGTCGVVMNTVDDVATCLADVDLAAYTLNLGDNAPFTLGGYTFAVARRRGVPWSCLAGTSNQSDYLSLFVANHMFYRLALPGQRRMLVDHIAFMAQHAPKWNPLSVVGQHMQQAGATPAEAMAFTLCSALQYAEDCRAAGLDLDAVLPRFSFFFDISISFFEEVAKFRAGRRIWSRLAKERLGAKDPKSWRFRFHAQTSGSDLTQQQPLINIARVAVQAIAGIFGGLQSLHTDAYDEALSSPTEEAARIAIQTQNVLREEAGLTDVIDPMGGSYYLETLTNEMEEKILAVIAKIDAAGGMYKAVEQGLVQRMIGESARRFQDEVESGARTVVGVNRYVVPRKEDRRPPPLPRLSKDALEGHLRRLAAFKAERSALRVAKALDAIAFAAEHREANLFEAVIEAADAGVTHGELCAKAREVLGDGVPLVVV
ncbi:MAG: methylmalonyl-CoA mutase [Alphaproteobacteria bacterium]|nr:methylmalonyl-CoA mutase [Alphaproteobacteria bacterium]